MKNIALHQLMNDMALGECVLPQASSAPLNKLTEIETFAVLDSLLSSLEKDYKNAKYQRLELVKLYGADDAMAQMAIDMEDSCWCAMQTRYIELRDDRVLMQRVQKMMYEAQHEYEECLEEKRQQKIEQEKRVMTESVKQYLVLQNMAKKRNKIPVILEWLILFLIFKLDITGQPQRQKQVNLAA